MKKKKGECECMRTCYVHVCAFIWVLYVLLATVIAVWKGLVTLDKDKEI